MRYAELHGNMQMYRIKSLYGNKMNLALMEDHYEKLSRIANSPAVRLAEQLNTPARQRLIQPETLLEEMVNGKPHQTRGKRLPLCEVICSCEPG